MAHEIAGGLGIVFIHGAGLGGWIWRDVLPLLDVPVLAVDFPRRDASFEARKYLTLDDYSADVIKKIEDLKAQKVVIVAHSLGGVVALKVAAALGDRLAGFVGVSAAIPRNGGSFLSSLPPLKSVFMGMMLRILGTRPPQSAIEQGLCHDLSAEQTAEVIKRFVPESRRPYLDKSNAPAPKVKSLYVKLTRDQEFDLGLQDKMAANLNASAVATMDTGHMPMLKDPKKLAGILEGFVKDLG